MFESAIILLLASVTPSISVRDNLFNSSAEEVTKILLSVNPLSVALCDTILRLCPLASDPITTFPPTLKLLDPNDISLEACDVLIDVFVTLISPNLEPDAAVIVPPIEASADTTRPFPLALDRVSVSLILEADVSSTSLCQDPP